MDMAWVVAMSHDAVRSVPARRCHIGMFAISCTQTAARSTARVPEPARAPCRAPRLLSDGAPGYLLFLRRGILGKPAALRARLTVFFMSIAIVIGPTPPGTGVMAPATCEAPA